METDMPATRDLRPSACGSCIIIFILIVAVLVSAPSAVRGASNPRYFPGDWSAYTSLRFVYCVAEAKDYMYFGTRGGVARWERFKERWEPPLTTADGLRDNNVYRLGYDPLTDELYAETPLGVSVYRALTNEWYDVPTFPDRLAQKWDTVDIGRYFLPFGWDGMTPDHLTDDRLRSYAIQGAYRDSRSNLWLGTWGNFIWQSDLAGYELHPMRWGLYNEDVSAIYLDSTRICFGSLNYFGSESALTVLDRRTKQWKYYESRYLEDFSSADVKRIAGEPNGRFLWLATNQGVVRFDTQKGEFHTFDEHDGLSDSDVLSVCVDGDIVWVGTEYGVDGIYTPNDSVFSATTDLIHGVKVYDIEVTDDVVWLGTDFGLFRLKKPTPEWKRFSYADSPLESQVWALAQDTENLYVGTERGIVMIDRQGIKPIRTFDNPSIIPYNDIYDLAVTDSILWIATNAGLLRFVPATHERRLFGRSDGMLDDIVESIVVDGDYLWLATLHGVNRFRWNNPLRID